MAAHLIPADDDIHHAVAITEELALALVDDPTLDYDAHHAATTAGRLANYADPDRPRPITIRFSNGWQPVPLTATDIDTADLRSLLADITNHRFDDDLTDLIDTTPANRARLLDDLTGLQRLLEVDHGPNHATIAQILDPEPMIPELQQLVDGNAPSGRPWTRIVELDHQAEQAWQRATNRITAATHPDPITHNLLYRQPLRPVDPALERSSEATGPRDRGFTR